MTQSKSSQRATTMVLEAVITDIRLESRTGAASRWQVALDPPIFDRTNDRTAAHPLTTLEATAKSGATLHIPIIELAVEDGIVWCVIEKPLVEGTLVRVHVLRQGRRISNSE